MKATLTTVLLATSCLVVPATRAAAQFEEPCELACIGVLSATSFVTATGAAVAMGRLTGGMSTVNQGLVVWSGTFAAMAGGGMGLSGNGARQERAVYAAGIGLLSGAAAGLAIEALRTGGDEPRMLAGTLIGAALGAIAGGLYGAISYDGEEDSQPIPLLTLSIPF